MNKSSDHLRFIGSHARRQRPHGLDTTCTVSITRVVGNGRRLKTRLQVWTCVLLISRHHTLYYNTSRSLHYTGKSHMQY